MPAYGRLSRHNRQELIDGARVEVAPYKRDPADFVLWKPSTPEQPGWDSPWGYGRPGWHIECSAMSAELLGEHFDIHGGGQDLIFPHHENELAQSVCALQHSPPNWGEPFVNIWMHNGYVVVGGEKMSKSLGNFRTVRDLLKLKNIGRERGEAIRLALLSAHYRQPLDFTDDKLTKAKEELDRFYIALRKLAKLDLAAPPVPPDGIVEALSDDLNTPLAIVRLHEALDALNQKLEKSGRVGDLEPDKRKLFGAGQLLGLLQSDPEEWLKGRSVEIEVPTAVTISTSLNAFVIRSDQSIQKLIDERDVARKSGKFAEADNIRAKLESEGIILEDHPDRPTDWRRA
jgi:cysteinyl-tRNA synthetase